MIVNIRAVVNSILVMLLFVSCTKKEQQYSYAYYYDKDSIPSSYLLRKVQYEKDYRIDQIFSSEDKGMPFKQMSKEKYVLQKDGLDRVIIKGDSMLQKPYLTTANNNCIEFLFDSGIDDVMATTHCFLGRENVLVGNKEYKNAYKFKKEQGKLDGVESIVYYDPDFIPLKEEYVSGYTADYRIVRLDTILTARQ